MLDYQRIVDDVRSLIGSQDAEGMDFLRAAAADYSVACDEVNERLSQCGSLLRQGLRSEAIQLCEIEPNLLDLVALLDFPERAAWIETANRCGMAPPPALQLEVAAALNEAYALEEPLAALLQQHRLLALTHGSLPTRIEVLRKLDDMDGNNPVWQEDLKVFERERQKQIQAEVEAAARAGDSDTLEMLDEELCSPEWKYPPMPEVVESAAQAHTRVRYWTVQSQLKQLATDLESAMSGFRVDSARTLRSQWNEIITSSGWQPQEQIAARVAPALAWLGEQDETQRQRQEQQAVVEALTKAAGHGRSLSELQDLHCRAVAIGPLPSSLEERYQSRLAILQRTARYRLWLQLAGGATGAVILIVVVGWIVSYSRYEQQVAGAVKNIPFMIEHGQIEQAEALVQDMQDPVKQDARVRKLLVLLEKSSHKEKIRHAEFSQQVQAADHWLERVLKSLADEPSQTVLVRLYDELDSIDRDVQRARSLARTEDDREEVAKVAEFASQVKSKWQGQLDKTFLGQYEQFDAQVTKLDREAPTGAKSQKAKLRELSGQLRKWETASAHVSPALLTRVTTIKERLSSLDKAAQQQGEEEEDERQITAAVGDIAGYLKALRDHIQRDPGSNHVPHFKRVVEESLCWQAVAEWDELAEQLHRTGIVGLQPAVAEEQYALAKAVSDSFVDCAECASIRRLLPYLQAIANRNNGGEPIDLPLKKLFADRLVADVWMVETSDGHRYYTGDQPELNAPFRYIVGFDGRTRRKPLTPQEVEMAKVDHAPQVAIAEQVQPILENLEDSTWEKSFCRIIAVIQSNHDVDPVLKLNLLQQVLQAGTRGSYCMEKAFARHLQCIKEARVNTFANWLDPKEPALDDARKEATKTLNRLPDIKAATKAAAQDFIALRRQNISEYRWVGWLHSTSDGRWECLMKAPPKKAGRLFIVCRPSSEAKPVLTAVGQFEQGATTIDTAATALLVSGRPVYLEMP